MDCHDLVLWLASEALSRRLSRTPSAVSVVLSEMPSLLLAVLLGVLGRSDALHVAILSVGSLRDRGKLANEQLARSTVWRADGGI
jgi:hypothetical protein